MEGVMSSDTPSTTPPDQPQKSRGSIAPVLAVGATLEAIGFLALIAGGIWWLWSYLREHILLAVVGALVLAVLGVAFIRRRRRLSQALHARRAAQRAATRAQRTETPVR